MAFEAFIPAMMTVAQGAMSYAAQNASGNAMLLAAQRKKAGADYAANQMEVNAGQQEAASQRGAAEAQRQGQLGLSRIQALAAFQGGSTTDPTVMNIKAKLNAEAGYRAALQLYQGDEAARSLRANAAATRYMGNAAMADASSAKGASDLAAGASLLKTGSMLWAQGGGTMFSKYNKGIETGMAPDSAGDIPSAAFA